ncbi:MAG TPA: hypothetical protein VF533_17535 [Solirubrobacteraceae bacterium]|jgi:hypothetical protein
MRPLLIAFLLLLIAAPAGRARTGSCRTGHVPRVTVHEDGTEVGMRYAIVACDSARHRHVLRRTRLRQSVRRGDLGRLITDVDAGGRHVVWAELVRHRRRPEVAVVVEADRRGHVRRRRTVWRSRRSRSLDVGVLRDGSVAWTAPRGRSDVVLLARPGRRAHRLGPEYDQYLGSEDGRTLRWERDTKMVYHDLLPLPLRDGCPRRSRFRAVSDTPDYRVTETGYASPDTDTLVGQVIRVCVRAEHRDLVVAQGDVDLVHSVSLLAGGWAVVWGISYDKYNCFGEVVERVSLRRAATSRTSGAGGCGEGPRPGVAQVVTPAGEVAWIDEPDPPRPYGPPEPQEAVLRATAGKLSAVLDRGAPGAIRDLRADGETYRWTNAGEPRSAPAR